MTSSTPLRRWLAITLVCLAACADENGAGRSDSDDEAERVDGGDSSAARDRDDDAGARPDTATPAPRDAAPGLEVDAGSSGDGGSDAGRDAGRDAGPIGEQLVETVVDETIVVGAGETFDGSGKRFIAGRALGDGSQDEDQSPVFKLEAGARLVHVTLGAPAADGIHTYGDVELEDIVWEDIGEDALTIKESGTVELRGGSARNGDDKVFQVNAASVFRISDFSASDAGKFIRQNGDTTFKVDVVIDGCDIARMDEAIFRTDSDVSTVVMTNTRYSEIGDALFIGVAEANITETNNTEY